MNARNILLQDTKERRKIKQEAIDILTKEYEGKIFPLKTLIGVLDNEIIRLENEINEIEPIEVSHKRERINIDNDVLEILKKYGIQIDFSGNLKGMNADEVTECFKKENFKGSLNTIRDRLERLCEEKRIKQVNEGAKRDKRYIL
jgi:hypothetical protein